MNHPTDDNAVPKSPPPIEETLAELTPPVVEGTGVQVGGPPASTQVRVHRDQPEIPGYQFVKRLGKGGMGVVWLCKDIRAGRLVAMKHTISDELTDQERLRFKTEAQAMAKLHHPNVVQVYDVDEFDGRPYFTMEFCPGGSLHEFLDRKPQPAKVSAEIVEKLALGMQHAHDNGIIHRDLKPANVLVSSEFGVRSSELNSETGSSANTEERQRRFNSELRTPNSELLKITDFGLAKNLEASIQATGSLDVMGTPSYMAPEQGSSTKQAGATADVWSLGIILYEAITGSLPFVGADRFETFLNVCDKDPVPPSEKVKCPRDLETICLKCLRKDPQDRYPTARALADDLRAFLDERSISARPMSRIEKSVKWVKKNPGWAAMISLFVVTLVSGTMISLYFAGVATKAAETERDKSSKLTIALNDALEQKKRRALAQVDTLLSADPRGVPSVLKNLEDEREEVLPRLKEVWAQPKTPRDQLRAALALLPVEPDTVRERLLKGMLEVTDPSELVVIRDELKPFMASRSAPLWKQFDEAKKPDEKLRLLVALAAFDPENDRWKSVGDSILQPWLSDNPLYLGTWTEALHPVRSSLIPSVEKVFRGEVLAELKHVAANILADYASDRPETLARLIQIGDDRQFNTIFPVIEKHRAKVVEMLKREATVQPMKDDPPEDESVQKWKPIFDDLSQETFAKHQSAAALGLMRLGEQSFVWPLLKSSPYPESRSRLIHRFASTGTDAKVLIEQLKFEQDVGIRRALILSLGQYSESQISPTQRQEVIDLLLKWYRDDPDSGIHGAIDWLLRPEKVGSEPRKFIWGQAKRLKEIDSQLAAKIESAPKERNWFVNGQGQTFAVLDSREPFLMSSPVTEVNRFDGNEAQHWRKLDRKYAVSTKIVTVAEFERFRRATKSGHNSPQQYAPEGDCPAITVTWYEAIQYCRWLSEREGIAPEDMVYPELDAIEKAKDGSAMAMPKDYLKKKGYRLLSEAEWEYAARGGTMTPYHFGGSVEWLTEYGWYQGNSNDRSWPAGQKKPNDLGLFDMTGNVFCWTHNRWLRYPNATRATAVLDIEESQSLTDREGRVLRGGSFNARASYLRSAGRNDIRPSFRSSSNGFRLSRTFD